MIDLDDLPEVTPEQIKQAEHDRIRARLKADIAQRNREKALKGFVPIKIEDFN